MKSIKLITIIILSFVNVYAFGQQTLDQMVHKRLRDTTDSIFEITEIPDKWRNESAVILAISTEMEYKKQLMINKFNNDYYFRSRVLLLDKAAVDNFSEFSFDQLGSRVYNREGIFLNIKIIKPDGSEHYVNTGEAVRMAMKSGAYRSRTLSSTNKLAITNLEVGDIIDYYFASIKTEIPVQEFSGGWLEFEPVFKPLTEKYPVLNGRISFLLERKSFINLAVANGAPEPVQTIKDDKNYYVINYSNLEKSYGETWSFPLRQEPAIRFKVVFNSGHENIHRRNLLGSPGIPKTKLSSVDHINVLNNIALYTGIKHRAYQEAIRFVKNNQLEKNKELLVEEIYYFLRYYMYFTQFNYYGTQYPNYYTINNTEFIKIFSNLLVKYKIEHMVFIGMAKSIGNIDNAVMADELTPGIKIMTNSNPVYIFRPTVHSNYGDIDPMLENTKIIGRMNFPSSSNKIISDSLKMDDYQHNVETRNLTVQINTGTNQNTEIDEKTTVKGHLRIWHNIFLLQESDYYGQEFTNMSKKTKISLKDMDAFNEKLSNASVKTDYAESKEVFLEYLKFTNSFSDIELDTLNIINTGRYNNKPDLEYHAAYQTADLLNNAGEYLIFDVGRLLGRQIEIAKKDRERTIDAFIDYPKTFSWNIEIQIPEGYAVTEFEQFNKTIENKTGLFSGKAILETDRIIIQATKVYKSDFLPIDLWTELVQMLDEANRYTDQKLIFTKI